MNPESVEVATSAAHNTNFFSPDLGMTLLTWVTFFLLLAVLYKFAWKPILSALDAREESIRRSVEYAEKTKAELAKIEEIRRQMIAETERKGKEFIEQSRKAAVEAAKTIEVKTRHEAQIILENARREIKEESEKAKAQLKQVSAQIAVELASKLIEENLDNEKNNRLISEFIKKI